MRIGIDARYLSHGLLGGVHTYVAHFIPALLALAADHDIILYADAKAPFELGALPANTTLRVVPWRGPLSSIENDLFLWRRMAGDRLDVVHFPANYGFGPRGVKTVITLHDAINLMPLPEIIRGHRKTARTVALMTYLHFMTRAAVRRADVLLTVSSHASGAIGQHLPNGPKCILAIPHAPTPGFGRITDCARLDRMRERYRLAEPFVLADALKNPGVLIRAWQRLPAQVRAGRKMVFFSRRADPPAEVTRVASEGLARLLIRPSVEDLQSLYNLADAFVFPSWIEGFGLPVLEAMASGSPVIASNRGSIPEVAGEAALLFDAEDSRQLAQQLQRVLESPDEAARLRALGLARARQFSWVHTARRILEAYQSLCTASQPRIGAV